MQVMITILQVWLYRRGCAYFPSGWYFGTAVNTKLARPKL